MPTPTKFSPAIDTNTTKSAPVQSAPAPTLGLVLNDVLNDMTANARHAAILLSEHRGRFDREPECNAAILRISSILHDMSVQLVNVRDSMSAETKAKLDAPR